METVVMDIVRVGLAAMVFILAGKFITAKWNLGPVSTLFAAV